jgi:hypothetical protein
MMEPAQPQESKEQPGTGQARQEESPLYEFAAPSASPQGQVGEAAPEEPEFVYPPPPSYYQNLQLPAERPPLPEQVSSQVEQPSTRTYYNPQARYAPQPDSRPPNQQESYPPRWKQPARRSRKQTWIIVSIILGCVLLLCGAGSWALYNVVGTVFQQVSGAPQVVQDFYQQVQSQNYNAAFDDVQISGQTLETFTQAAQALDTQYGPVKSFQLGSTNPGATWQITVSVTRTKATYAVFISVDNANGTWKITGIDLTRF